MKIGVDCPSCRASFQVAAEHAGKRGKCPSCGNGLRVPGAPAAAAPPAIAPEPEEETYGLVADPKAVVAAQRAAVRVAVAVAAPVEAAPTRPTRSPREILAAFRGEIRPVRATWLYRLWVLLIAGVMILLPALYVGLIALVGYGLVLQATHGQAIFETVRVAKVALVLYAGPLAVGAIVIAFMLKPLFARPTRRAKARAIDPSKEPLLAAFVDGVCASVGAPTPARIEVDCQVNASAHLASGALSPARELVLTIGLPLVAGLSLKQFTGVLAHEFGHFSQGAGMRLSLLIRSINHWFARVVYQRDEWDEALADWSGEGHVAVMLVAGLARASVWLTRRVLWVLMQAGHLASGFLMRQMEFDADRYEARMVGGAAFAETMGRIAELGLASQAAHHELQASWRERRLPDDLPRLTRIEAGKLPEPLRAALRAATGSRRGGLFDTHPPDGERVARALAEGPEGIFDLAGPATDLFRDFDALARAATFDYYRSQLGRDVSKDQLYPIKEALQEQAVRRAGDESFDRFFLGCLGTSQALELPPSYPGAPADPKAAKRALVAARAAMQEARDGCRDALRRSDEIHPRVVNSLAALALLKAGKGIKAAEFGLGAATVPAAQAAQAAAEAADREVAGALEPFGRPAALRLATALGLLELDAVAGRVADGAARRREARALYPCAEALGGRIVPELAHLTRAVEATSLLARRWQAGRSDDDQAMVNAVLRGGRGLHERLTELKWKIGDAIAYPFEHARDDVTLGRYALPMVPEAKAVGDLIQAGVESQDRLLALNRRVLGRLAATAEAVETALGLPPLQGGVSQEEGSPQFATSRQGRDG